MVPLAITDDATFEGNETIDLSVTAVSGAIIGIQNAATFTITENDPPPAVNLSVVPGSVSENGSLTLTATSAMPAVGNQTVDLALNAGSGAIAADFTTALPAQITIPNGMTMGSIVVALNDDATVEGTENAIFEISNPSAGLTLGTTTAGATIADNDFPPIEFSSATFSAGEGAGMGTVTLTRPNVPIASSVQVNITGGTATGGGTDFDDASFPLTVNFAAGDTMQTVPIPAIADDALFEGNETIDLSLTAPSGATLGAQNTATFTINDNDAAPAVDISVTPGAIAENGSPTLTVTATSPIPVVGNQTVDVTLSGTADAADFTAPIPTQIAIADGTTSGSFNLTLDDDSLVEGPETATFTISNPTPGIAIGTASANAAIADDDFPTVELSIAPVSGSEAAGTSITLTVTASQPVTGDQTVSVSVGGASTNTADFVSLPAQITIPNGATVGSATFNIADDGLVEGTETAIFNIFNPSAGIVLGTTTSGSITIFDGNLPTVELSINTTTASEADETELIVTAIASDPVSGNQNLNIELGGAGVTADDFTTSFPAAIAIADGQTTGSVTFRVASDALVEGEETAVFNATNFTSGIVPGAIASVSTAIADDIPTLAFAKSTTPFLAPEDVGNSDAIALVRTGNTNATSTVEVAIAGGTATDGSDYNSSNFPLTVTFEPGETMQVVPVAILNDSDFETGSNETIEFEITNVTGGAIGTQNTAVLEIVDDEVVRESEPNNAPSTAQLLADTLFTSNFNPAIQDFSGTNISMQTAHATIVATGDDSFDYFTFTAAAGEIVTLDIDDNNFDTEIFLFDAAGNLLIENNDAIEPGHIGDNFASFLEFAIPTAGNYTIGVGQFNSEVLDGELVGSPPPENGTYTLHVSRNIPPPGAIFEVEPNNSLATPQFLGDADFNSAFDPNIQTLDGTNISTQSSHVSIAGTGDGTFDYYALEANLGDTLLFDIDDNNFDSELFLFFDAGPDFNIETFASNLGISIPNVSATLPEIQAFLGTFGVSFADLGLSPIDLAGLSASDIPAVLASVEALLINSAGVPVAANDNRVEIGHVGGEFPSFVEYLAPADGTYIVGVGKFNSDSNRDGVFGNPHRPGRHLYPARHAHSLRRRNRRRRTQRQLPLGTVYR